MSKPPPPAIKAPPPPGARSAPAAAARHTRKPLVIKPREVSQIGCKLVIPAVEGFGKTTIAAYAPSPLILMSPLETGYQTLLNAGRVPQGAALDIASWPELLDTIDQLTEDPQGIKTLALDAIGGFEKLMFEHVCQTKFGGDWDSKKDGFDSWGGSTGHRACIRVWPQLLHRLESLAIKQGVDIIVLTHVKLVKAFHPDFGEYQKNGPDIHPEYMWPPLKKWADDVLYGTFETFKNNDGIAIAGEQRVFRTTHTATADAKNKRNMPSDLPVNCPPEGMYDLIFNYINQAK